MNLTVEAVYEDGVLKPDQPLPLKEHERVRIAIHAPVDTDNAETIRAFVSEPTWADRTAGLLQWTGDPEILRAIAEDDEYGILEAR